MISIFFSQYRSRQHSSLRFIFWRKKRPMTRVCTFNITCMEITSSQNKVMWCCMNTLHICISLYIRVDNDDSTNWESKTESWRWINSSLWLCTEWTNKTQRQKHDVTEDINMNSYNTRQINRGKSWLRYIWLSFIHSSLLSTYVDVWTIEMW